MESRKAGYTAYTAARTFLRRSRLINFISPRFRAIAARLIYEASTKAREPLTVGGHKMFLAQPGRYASLDMVGDRYEVGTTQWLHGCLKPGDVFVDIGAHVGYYTLLAARLVGPTGKVYAFEPEPYNHALLCRNIELNGYRNITVIRKAVSNRAGTSVLFLSGLDNGFHSLRKQSPSQYKRGSMIVETTTLDAFLDEAGCSRVDLVKMDIEGWELIALEGMRELLSRPRSMQIITEFCPVFYTRLESGPVAFLHALMGMGLTLQVIGPDGLHPIQEDRLEELVDELWRTEGYTNLLCTTRGGREDFREGA